MNTTFVKNSLLQFDLNKKSKKLPSAPKAHKRAIITAITMAIPMIYLSALGASSNFKPFSPATKPHSKRATNITTIETVRNRMRFPTTSFGKTAVMNIRPMTNAMRAFSCFLSEPNSFDFSRIPKAMKKISRNG